MRQKIIQENGFTLIELMVGINIGFIAIAVAFSVYLIIYKYFYFSFSKNEEKISVYQLFNALESKLNKCEYFEIDLANKNCVLKTSNNNMLELNDGEIKLNDIAHVFSTYSITLFLHDGDRAVIKDGRLESQKLFSTKRKLISSKEISKIDLLIDRQKYSYTIHINRTRKNKFRNIL